MWAETRLKIVRIVLLLSLVFVAILCYLKIIKIGLWWIYLSILALIFLLSFFINLIEYLTKQKFNANLPEGSSAGFEYTSKNHGKTWNIFAMTITAICFVVCFVLMFV